MDGDTTITAFLNDNNNVFIPGSFRQDEIRVERSRFIESLIFIRKVGSSYIRVISIEELQKCVTNFLEANYQIIYNDIKFNLSNDYYINIISNENQIKLADSIRSSPMFLRPNNLVLYNVQTLNINSDFDGSNFFIAKSSNLSKNKAIPRAFNGFMDGTFFPPVLCHDMRRKSVPAWLGIKSIVEAAADKYAAAIVSAISLSMSSRERYLFSGREIFGARCTLEKESYTFSYYPFPHTPPLMYDITISKSDGCWLSIIDAMIENDEDLNKRYLKALEYFYRAWFLLPQARFPLFFMAIDALIGVRSNHTRTAIDFVIENIDQAIEKDRLVLLMNIRGAVIHGAAPDVYESENYQNYYERYQVDPIKDVELICCMLLRKLIFNGKIEDRVTSKLDRGIISDNTESPYAYKKPSYIIDID